MNTEKAYIIPATDVVEMSDGMHVFIDLPGVPTDGLSIHLDENSITIIGKSDYGTNHTCPSRTLHSEFGGVVYKRVFSLSDIVDREKITASLDQGILNIFLPKSEAMVPRRIPVISNNK